MSIKRKIQLEEEKERIKLHFDSLANSYDSTTDWVYHKGLLNDILGMIDKKTITILDVACGTGIVGNFIKNSLNSVFVIGIDLSGKMCSETRKKGIPAIQANAESLPFRDNSIDCMICRQWLHYSKISKALKEWKRVLKPNGYAVVSQLVSNGEAETIWWKKVKKMVQPLRKTWFSLDDIYNFINQNSWRTLSIKTRYIKNCRPLNQFLVNCLLPASDISKVLHEWKKFSPPSIDFTILNNIVKFNEFWATWSMSKAKRVRN